MRSRIGAALPPLSLILMLALALLCESACTFYGEHPARAFSDATGGEALERVFWNDVQASNWAEIDRVLASNYMGVTPAGTLDHSATMEDYRQWRLKEFSLGDLKTEMNGTTVVVTYAITLNGTMVGMTNGTPNAMPAGTMSGTAGNGGSQPLPSGPLHMMTVWQQQKSGWVAIAHSVSN